MKSTDVGVETPSLPPKQVSPSTVTKGKKKHYILTEAGVIGEGSYGRAMRFTGMRLAGLSSSSSPKFATIDLSEQEEKKFGSGLELVVKMLPVGKYAPGSEIWNGAVRGLRQEANIYAIMNNEV